MASSEKLPEAPARYDKADQDRTRRLIERGLAQPPAKGTVQQSQLGSSATLAVERGDVLIADPVKTLDFAATDFDLSQAPSQEVNISIPARFARIDTAQVWSANQDLFGTNLFWRIGDNVNDNVFFRWISASDFGEIQTQIGGAASGNFFLQRSGGAVVVGADTTGQTDALRVVGNITVDRRLRFVTGGVYTGQIQMDAAGQFNWYDSTPTERMRLTTVALTPAASGLLTLGSTTLPWGDGHFTDELLLYTTGPTTLKGRIVVGGGMAIGPVAAGGLLFLRAEDVDRANLSPTLFQTFSGVDLQIGSLGRFDSTIAPATDQLLSFDGSVSKWRPRTVQLTFNSGVMVASALGDGSQWVGANSNPALSGAPAAPGAAPIVTAVYGGFIVDMNATALPANTVYVLDYSKNGGAYTSGAIVATSGKIVHQIIQNNAGGGAGTSTDTFAYKFKLRGASDSAYSPASSAISFSTKTEVNAFGLIAASQIACVNLAAVVADLGVITAGRIQNAAIDAGIRVSPGYTIPGTFKRYLDLVDGVLVLKDDQGSPVTRVKAGKVGAGAQDHGLQVFDKDAATCMDFTGAKRILAVPVQPSNDSGTSIAIDLSTGLTQQVRLTGTATITLNNPINGGRYRLWLQQDTVGSRPFPTFKNAAGDEIVMFTNDAAPTLTTTPGAMDLFELEYRTSPTARFTCMPLQTNVLLPAPKFESSLNYTPNADATTHNLTVTGAVSGRLLLTVFGYRETGASSINVSGVTSGWTIVADSAPAGGNPGLAIIAKISDGTETTLAVTTSLTSAASGTMYSFSRWFGSLSGLVVSSFATGNSANPNSGSLTPGWTVDRDRWLSAANQHGSSTITTVPSNYTDGTLAQNSSATLTSTVTARRALYATTEDPAAWTLSASAPWVAATIAIRPPA